MAIKAFAYYRTSSQTNVDGDSQARQRAAVEAYAKAQGVEIVREFYDAAVSGADPIGERAGFKDMLEAIAGNGVRTILVETANRFARDIIVQETGWKFLKAQGIDIVAVDSPSMFLDTTPTANLIRQILGAVAEFEKAALVAKLAAARRRTGRHGGKPGLAQTAPALLERVRVMRSVAPDMTLRAVAEALEGEGELTSKGKRYSPAQIARMLKYRGALY
jgi:DNA invertase Pin-like site-specific DNA recombinase